MCGGSGWIELGGSGMVHPNVLREAEYDPEVYSGWAFGFGVERLGLARYGVDDIRRFVESDPDFLEQLVETDGASCAYRSVGCVNSSNCRRIAKLPSVWPCWDFPSTT